jgi:hypothetical protein
VSLNADTWNVIGVSKPKMMVMPSCNSGMAVGRLVGMYPKRLGWLLSPIAWKQPLSWMPYALDNGAFSAWLHKKEWDEGAFVMMLERARRSHFPLWVVVPDVVADREATLDKWDKWVPQIRSVLPHTDLAFAVQDGMTKDDVPSNADVVFVGGTTEWKWKNLRTWTDNFKRVHVARVNSERLLWMADDAGAVSCDGTGWMRGGEERLIELEHYLEISTGRGRPQMVMESIMEGGAA